MNIQLVFKKMRVFLLAFVFACASGAVGERVSDEFDGRYSRSNWYEPPSLAVGGGLVSATQLQASQPRLAFIRSKIVESKLRGEIGEALVRKNLYASGGWKSIRPRGGPQGIDHIWVKFDSKGNPRGLMVGETKYGTSRLGMTKDGLQASDRWIASRLKGVSEDYRKLYNQTLASSRKTNPNSVRRLKNLANYLEEASKGKIAYRTRLFRVRILENNTIEIINTPLNAAGKPIGKGVRLKPISIAASQRAAIKGQLVGEIKRQFPYLTHTEAISDAEKLLKGEQVKRAITAKPITPSHMFRAVSRDFVGGALVIGVLDTLFQTVAGDAVDWSRTARVTALGGTSSALGGVVGRNMTRSLMTNPGAHSKMLSLSRTFGLPASRASSLLAGVSAGSVATLAFSYGGYFVGLYDLKTANRTAIAGVSGAAIGSAAWHTALAAASTWGTASTGTAIAGLGGAAKASAATAWWGGGSLAAGGTGVAGGTVVLTAGVAAVAIVAALAIHHGFQKKDEAEEWKRIGGTIDVLQTHQGDYPGNPFLGNVWLQ